MNSKKIKIVTVVGTRPELIRLSRILAKLDQYCDHYLIHTGQNYDFELGEIFYEDLGLRRPDRFLECAAASSSACQTIANIISRVDLVLNEVKPDAFLVLGDTNSCLSAICAKRRRVPIFHLEAGNRCFDQRVPEETNRKIVDHISDINLTYSAIARDYLLAEGCDPDRVIRVGSPMLEVLEFYRDKILRSDIVEKLGLDAHGYYVLSCHREENIESAIRLRTLVQTVNKISEIYQSRVVFSVHPRTRARLSESGVTLHQNVMALKPLSFTDYIKLQMNSRVVLSDSGTIQEEASILNFDALNLRDSHERPEAIEEGGVMLTGLDSERILQCLEILESNSRTSVTQSIPIDYTSHNVSDKVLKIIMGYAGYVNRVVWHNY